MKRSGDEFVVESRGFTKSLRRCSSSSSDPSSSTSHHLELEQEEEEDGISKLPDHILVLILNLMMTNGVGKKGEIEQVVRTSVLARRWRCLWNYSLKSLIFTFTLRDSRFDLEDDKSVIEAAHRAFVDRVNLILALPLVGDTLDDFNLTLWLDNRQTYWSHHLPGWIGFACQKRVKRLTINLEHFDSGFTLDNKVIGNHHNMDSLLSLCLDRVNVTGEFLEFLLTICGSLQHLSVSESSALVQLTVSGPFLKLKYLKIHRCLELQRLYIRHVKNLVSLDYDPNIHSNHADVVIEDAPCLVNARLNFFPGKDKTYKVLSHLPRLQTLALAFDYNWLPGTAVAFPRMTNLVKVELELLFQSFVSTICASVLVSCPSITELVIKFERLSDGACETKVERRLEHPHKCLKVVELVGFVACKLAIGVALYLIENTLSLEKIVVDTSHPYREVDTRTMAEEFEDSVCELKLMHGTVTELEMQDLADSVPRARAHYYETISKQRAAARAYAKRILATTLSGTSTQLVLR